MTYRRSFSEGILMFYINDILHLAINRNKLLGIRTWYIKPELNPDPFFIEITYENNKVICQYDSKEKWMAILNLINESLI